MKRGIKFKMSNTPFRVRFAVLYSSIGKQLTSKHRSLKTCIDYCICRVKQDIEDVYIAILKCLSIKRSYIAS